MLVPNESFAGVVVENPGSCACPGEEIGARRGIDVGDDGVATKIQNLGPRKGFFSFLGVLLHAMREHLL